MGYPSLKCLVLSLNSLQNLGALIPLDPRLGPSGGVGKACRVGMVIRNLSGLLGSLGHITLLAPFAADFAFDMLVAARCRVKLYVID